MKFSVRHFYFFFFLLFLQAGSLYAQTPQAYKDEIAAWDKKRLADLKAPEGWINLAGLYWLHPGKNSFGSQAGNDLLFINDNMPARAGYFELSGNKVEWHTQQGVDVRIDNKPVHDAVIFHPDINIAPLLSLSSFRWNIIKREDKIGVRFRDLNSPALETFPGIERYDADISWRIVGHLETATNTDLFIKNVLGQTITQKTPGKLTFTIGGMAYSLDAIDEGGDELFIIFGDATSGADTYPAGRFMYVKKPDANGNTILDFNKAFNPPCAFTPYATCPLPPKQNILPIAITAGEKNIKYEVVGH